jgi:hypothetical protein
VFIRCAFPDEDPDRTSQLVRKDGVGGLLLSGGSLFDVPSFVNWAQKVAKVPVLVAADFERGARVSGATEFPPDAELRRRAPRTSPRRRRAISDRRRALSGSGC